MNPSYKKIIQFIREVYQKPEGYIPLHEPLFVGNEKKYLNECIDSTYVSSVGKFVDLFEENVAKYTESARAVVCVNGTNAIHLALQLVGVKQDDEVITQPLTFVATCNAISYCKATPVFVDVDIDTMGLSPKALLHFLENNTEQKKDGCYNKLTKKKISACIPMHTFGHPCRIDEIVEICTNFNIEVIEDAAESIGSYYKGKHTGTFGKIGVLSFNGNKIITTGGGGMLLFNDKELAHIAKHLSTQAKIPHKWEFEHDEIGYNYRMPNINAAIGVAQLEQIDEFIKAKRKLAVLYKSFFEKENIRFISEPMNAKSNYWLNSIVFHDKTQRDEFLEFSNKKEIMTRPTWKLMNQLGMFKSFQTGILTNAEWLADRVVNIPSSVIL